MKLMVGTIDLELGNGKKGDFNKNGKFQKC